MLKRICIYRSHLNSTQIVHYGIAYFQVFAHDVVTSYVIIICAYKIVKYTYPVCKEYRNNIVVITPSHLLAH